MKKQRIIISSIVAVLLIVGLIYFGFKNNIFADAVTPAFSNATYKLSADDLGNGDFLVHANIDPQFANLQDQAAQYSWRVWSWSSALGVWNKPGYSTLDPEYKVSYNSPGVKYVSLVADTENPEGNTAISSKMTGIVLVVKNSDGTLPEGYSENLISKFFTRVLIENESINPKETIYNSKFIEASEFCKKNPDSCPSKDIEFCSKNPGICTIKTGSAITGDFKIPLTKDSVTFFSKGMLAIPLGKVETQVVEIDLPAGVTLEKHSNNYYPPTECTASDIPAGYHRYRIKGPQPFLSQRIFIYPTFSDTMIGQKDLSMRLKVYKYNELIKADGSKETDLCKIPENDPNTVWQTQKLTLEAFPSDIQLPKRLTTSFTWTTPTQLLLAKNTSEFVDLYSKLGFNTVPWTGGTAHTNFTPEYRKAWPEGMRYGPEVSLYYYKYLLVGFFKSDIDKGICKNYTECIDNYTKDLDTFNAYAGLNGSKYANTKLTSLEQLSAEKTKWLNAVKYNDDNRYLLDIAYDGVFLQKELESMGQWVKLIQPEYLFFDYEPNPPFPSQSGFAKNLSQNAKDYRDQNNLSDDEAGNAVAANAVADRFLTIVTAAIYENSPMTKISWYPAKTTDKGTDSYQMFPWALMQKHNIASSGHYYYTRSSDLLSKYIGGERKNLGNNYEILPWLTNGTYGEMSPQLLFDHVIHVFLNGATGFSIFADLYNDDMADVLNISKAIKLVSPHEDLIMDGELAKDDMTSIKNATVSAMKKDSEYLIAVTPRDKSKKVEFTINTAKSQEYNLIDEKTKTTESVSGKSIKVSKVFSESTVLSLTPKLVVPSPTPTPTSTISSPPNPPVPTTSYTFPKGFSTLGVTKSFSTSLITTVDGLYVYQFDGINNKWLMAPTDSFTLEPSKGYYVYNKQDAKTISLPYDTFSTNSYSLTKGWNLLYSSNAKQRSAIQLNHNNTGPATIDSLIQQNKINSNVFIIDNDQSKDSCTYFSLLDNTDESANCAISSLKKQTSIPASKAFWVYVK